MKSTAFAGKYMTSTSYGEFDAVESIQVSTLSAYAVEYSEFTPPPDLDVGHTMLYHDSDYQIVGDSLVFNHAFRVLHGGLEPCRLVIHHHGIRDYSLLFPQVENDELRDRLGCYYKEAESAFDSGAWLSFALMAGAVYEGLLGWRLQDANISFHELIKRSATQAIIASDEQATLNRTREIRNLIHASKYSEEWVSRAHAMDIRVVMDRLIRTLSIDANSLDSPKT